MKVEIYKENGKYAYRIRCDEKMIAWGKGYEGKEEAELHAEEHIASWN